MKRMLFIRRYRSRHGGHITVRDFFRHSMEHPQLDPYVYFTPDSDMDDNDIWASIPADRFVEEPNPLEYDVVFVGGAGWRSLPRKMGKTEVVNVCLHVRHAENPYLRKCLARPAYRIADAQEVYDAILPLANGPVEVIHEAFDFELFSNTEEKMPRSVLIFGQKNPQFADSLAETLKKEGVNVTSFNVSIPQAEFAALMRQSEVFVGLPHRTEGFYRPPIEAMAAGCAVVSSDAVGSRVHLKKDVTCLQPEFGDLKGYLRDIRRLLDDEALRGELVTNGAAMAENFSFAHQRGLYHDFIDRHLFGAGGTERELAED